MLSARPSRLFDKLFSLYNRHYLLRRHFHGLMCLGEPEAPGGGPVLYMMNHCSWWDGLVLYDATRHFSPEWQYVMMDGAQLRKYAFFRRFGAFGIDRSSGISIARALRYTAGLLHEGKSVWMFPQGAIRHQEERPLRLQDGIGYVLRQCPHAVVRPVTVYYSLCARQKPDVSLWFGERVRADWPQLEREQAAALLEKVMERQLDEHRRLVVQAGELGLAGVEAANGERFVPLLSAGRSTSEAFDRWRGR